MKKAILYIIMLSLLAIPSIAVIRINNAQNIITGGEGNFTNVTVNRYLRTASWLIGSGSFVGNITTDGNNFIFNVPNGSLQVNAPLNLSSVLYVGNNGTDGNKFIYFFEDSSQTGEVFSWSDTNDQFSISDSLALSDEFRGDSDFMTTGAGDDLWLGTSTQASSNASLYAEGLLCLDLWCGDTVVLKNETYYTQTNTMSVNYTAVGNASFALTTSGKDLVECVLFVGTAATTTGAQFQINVTGSSAGRITVAYLNGSGSYETNTSTTVTGSVLNMAVSPASWSSIVQPVQIWVSSTRSGAGFFQVYSRTEVHGSGVDVNSGSYCTAMNG